MNGVFLLLYTVAVGCNTVVGLDFIVVGISAAPWFPFSALPFVVWHVECYTATDASPYRISSIKRDNSWARISGVDNAWWAPSNRKKPHKRLSAEHVSFLLLSVTVCFDAATQHKLHFRRIEIDFHSMFDSMPVPGQSVTLKTLSYPEIWLPFPICLLLSHRYPTILWCYRIITMSHVCCCYKTPNPEERQWKPNEIFPASFNQPSVLHGLLYLGNLMSISRHAAAGSINIILFFVVCVSFYKKVYISCS